jgi:hypothetical protein
VFLCLNEFEVEGFVKMNNTGGPVDVWEVAGASEGLFVASPGRHLYFPGSVAAARVSVFRRDVALDTDRRR